MARSYAITEKQLSAIEKSHKREAQWQVVSAVGFGLAGGSGYLVVLSPVVFGGWFLSMLIVGFVGWYLKRQWRKLREEVVSIIERTEVKSG